jgi:CRP/FNR family cyclic AMP-dependent transcriptional regulator
MGLYLVVEGSVKVSRLFDYKPVMVNIYKVDEFFGEYALLGPARQEQMAAAFTDTSVMAWSIDEICDLADRRPALGIALLQLAVQRCSEFVERIDSFSLDNIERRLVRSLIYFSQRFGTQQPEGSVRIGPLTHDVLAEYVGTSREIVTNYMNVLRRQGYISYSRKGIFLKRDVLREWLTGMSTAAAASASAEVPRN